MTRLTVVLSLMIGVAYADIPDSLQKAVLLYAPFDGSADAAYARGDAQIYNAPDYKSVEKAQAGVGRVDVEIVPKQGVSGDALRFRSVNQAALFYKADRNTAYSPEGWSGAVSFWLRLDPDKDLKGFSDPIQITDKAYNDACIWVDFTKDERPRHFRLGVFGDLSVWNPRNLEPDKNPAFEKRLVVLRVTPFSSSRWTHVTITWSGLGGNAGWARLYVDGKIVGSAEKVVEPFTWEPGKGLIRLGVNYAGLFDELAIFDRALNHAEVQLLRSANSGTAGRR